ncbi:hypothetical protein QBC43DRAFT_319771 [Cladorrhinum sp. PSN259]|nr:hypothetical protein QBC43DRAFT_319771 [Cladorrhinum sp. PSN259]
MDRYRQLLLSTLISKVVTPAQCCQSFFLLAAALVLAVAAMPSDAKTLLVNYGARKASPPPFSSSSSSSSSSSPPQSSSPSEPSKSADKKLQKRITAETWWWWWWWKKSLAVIDDVTSWSQVPHSWFGAFYLLSVGLSIFWLGQYLTDGYVWRLIASKQSEEDVFNAGHYVTKEQVAVGWTMMFLQGARRVFEHATIIKPSKKSTMWVVHWFLGLFFYLFMSVSVWVEGSGSLLNLKQASTRGDPSNSREAIFKLAIGIPAFLYAWINQFKCHEHLAGLKKYSLPEAGLFRHFICAHYTCECLLYLSMAIATAPQGAWCNRTLLCAVTFVAVNLGVTASGTRKWYASKFGIGPIANRWNMIPFVF